jgi:hypothetical protein
MKFNGIHVPEPMDGYPAHHEVLKCVQVPGHRLNFTYNLNKPGLDGWTKQSCGITAPDSGHLFNFNVPVPGPDERAVDAIPQEIRFRKDFPTKFPKSDAILVLDDYGDEVMPTQIRHRVLHSKSGRETIGIQRSTGEILRVGFIVEMSEKKPKRELSYGMTYWSFDKPLFVPVSWWDRLDELKSEKRPYAYTLRADLLMAFITRYVGYETLQEDLSVELRFRGSALLVTPCMWREMGDWK